MTQRVHQWIAAAATCLGAAHESSHAPNQDAYATLVENDVTALAVADGHGDAAHFRSQDGSRIAVELAVSWLIASARRSSAPALRDALDDGFTAQLLDQWRRQVLGHADAEPFSQVQRGKLLGSGDDAVLRAYGTTLIGIVATPAVMGFAQIGDGDAVVAFADGEVVRPLPADPQLDGLHTTSLAQRDAATSLRIAVLDLSQRPINLAFAVTDGFAAPQVDGVGWWRQVGEELSSHLTTRGAAWVTNKLPGWLLEPAQTGGDDTTMGLLLNDAATPSDN